MDDAKAELFEIADKLSKAVIQGKSPEIQEPLKNLEDAAKEVGKSWSGSSLGYHSYVYYDDLETPPPGSHFSVEWGLMDTFLQNTIGDWREWNPDDIQKKIYQKAKIKDLKAVKMLSEETRKLFLTQKSEVLSILNEETKVEHDNFLEGLQKKVEELECLTEYTVANDLTPTGAVYTRDSLALGKGRLYPPHIKVRTETILLDNPFNLCESLENLVRRAASHLMRKKRKRSRSEAVGTNIFIGHGRSTLWKDLKDFIQDRLQLPWDEFNRVPVAGITNISRLSEMLDSAAIAFLVMTAEDEQKDGKIHARLNVVHEAGLFQGRLGFSKAIILLEDGCEDFSNIEGLGQIRFPKGDISRAFEEIRRVLEREKLIGSSD